MNLKSEIRPELWECIERSYQSQLYKAAILDAMHFLSDVLRDRADVDGDGEALVGRALGGTPPRLYINQLQTASDRDEQKGFETIIRGLYGGIRNPRSHEQTEDKRETADAVIHFISFLLTILNKSQAGFSLDTWIASVFDPDFVDMGEYAQTLVSEVPPKKCLDTVLALYAQRDSQYARALEFIFPKLLEKLNPEQKKVYLAQVGQDLRTLRDVKKYKEYYDEDGLQDVQEYVVSAEPQLTLIIRILPNDYWPDLDYAARLRIENKLIESIKIGKYDLVNKTCESGVFGTWATRLLQYFDANSKRKLGNVMLEKLRLSIEDRAYLRMFFLNKIPHLTETARDPEAVLNTFAKLLCTGIIEDIHAEPYVFNPWPLVNSIPAELHDAVMLRLKEQAPEVHEQFYLSDEDIPF